MMSIDWRESCIEHGAVLQVEYIAHRFCQFNMPDRIPLIVYKSSTCSKGCSKWDLIHNIDANLGRMIGRDPKFNGKIITLDQHAMSLIKPIIQEIKQEKLKEEILTQQAVSYFFNLA